LKRVEVLDKGFIELIYFMPHPLTGVGGDTAIVNAARTSYLGESKGKEADKKLLFYLMEHRHTTPFEQVEFKFRVKAPLVVWWQWARHRTWSYNAQSGRYSELSEDDVYVPDVWRTQSKTNKQGSEEYPLSIKSFDFGELSEVLLDHYRRCFYLYKYSLFLGVAIEQARLFLPGFAIYYTWVCKVNAHNLIHFLKLRMSNEAQEEIRIYAKAIY
jgi:thymidylate synthase (FAD)